MERRDFIAAGLSAGAAAILGEGQSRAATTRTCPR
jgi:hypothetical protein